MRGHEWCGIFLHIHAHIIHQKAIMEPTIHGWVVTHPSVFAPSQGFPSLPSFRISHDQKKKESIKPVNYNGRGKSMKEKQWTYLRRDFFFLGSSSQKGIIIQYIKHTKTTAGSSTGGGYQTKWLRVCSKTRSDRYAYKTIQKYFLFSRMERMG